MQVAALISTPLRMLGEGQRVPQLLGRLSEMAGIEAHAIETNVYVPAAGPVYRSEAINNVFDNLEARGDKVAVMITTPCREMLWAANAAHLRGFRVIYDRFDHWPSFPSAQQYSLADVERDVLDEVDALVCTFQDEVFGQYEKPKLHLPNAASDAPLWPQRWLKGRDACWYAQQTTAVYIGSLDERYVAMDALRAVGELRPTLVCGQSPQDEAPLLQDGMQAREFGRGAEVGWVSHSCLSFVLASGDRDLNATPRIGLALFRPDQELTRWVSPIKVYEYLLAGVRPVVWNLHQARHLPFVSHVDGPIPEPARTVDSVAQLVSRQPPFSPEMAKQAQEWVMDGHLWRHRAHKLVEWLNGLW